MARVSLYGGATPTGRAVKEAGSSERMYRPISGVLMVEYRYVTPRHSLYNYGDNDGEVQGKRLVEIFRYKGRQYALGQFMRIGWPVGDYIRLETGEAIEGYDSTEYYKPYLLQLVGEENCVRLWEQVEKGE